MHMGIFFKYASLPQQHHTSLLNFVLRFALDWEGLYGSDEYAMKAASHELNGLASVHGVGASIGDTRLCVPLMILLDELGFRFAVLSPFLLFSLFTVLCFTLIVSCPSTYA